ncbi:MAG TPA: hypothetical protein VFW28_17665 [Micropepsaceae bacterium]|nr:hypothetical protein [Micropepsaceae bacterium]
MNTGTLVYRLSAFDRRTGRRVFMQEIPKSKVRLAKKNAGIEHPFEDFAGEQPLTWHAASMIAELIGAHINRTWSFYLSPTAIGGPVHVEHA